MLGQVDDLRAQRADRGTVDEEGVVQPGEDAIVRWRGAIAELSARELEVAAQMGVEATAVATVADWSIDVRENDVVRSGRRGLEGPWRVTAVRTTRRHRRLMLTRIGG